MLAPDDRMLLLESLRPSAGTRLDYAVATTFTLDLMSALMVPLAFAGYTLRGSVADPMTLMEAVRMNSNRIDVYCQAGVVRAPAWRAGSDLFALLESMIHEVPRPRPGHLFHPKVWVARYVDDDEIYSYRCIITSRNLTADRSWDTVLRLDSMEGEHHRNRGNDVLTRFLLALPQLARGKVAEERELRTAELADQLRRVSWELPAGAQQIQFWAWGVPGLRAPKAGELMAGYRQLIVAPFVEQSGLDALLEWSRDPVPAIVSRVEALDALPGAALSDRESFVIDALAGLGFESESDASAFAPNEDLEESPPTELAGGSGLLGGLHAKLYVAEVARRAKVFVGSANATGAAFGGNVEILCELSGGSKALGVDNLLTEKAPFRSLLVPYRAAAAVEQDPAADAAWKVESLLIDVAQIGFSVHVEEGEGGWIPTVSSDESLPSVGFAADVEFAPYNRPNETFPVELGQPFRVNLAPRAVHDLTAFLVCTVSATIDGHPVTRHTICCGRLLGSPADRLDEILVRQIDTPEKFLRLLALLLGLGDSSILNAIDATSNGASGSWDALVGGGSFELLVRALAMNPGALDRLDDIIRRLESNGLAAQVLPARWGEIWSVVSAARTLIGQEHR